MKLNANDMVSRATIASSRNLILVSGSLFSIHYFGLKSDEWVVLGKTIPANLLDQLAFYAVIFLAVTHLVHWSSDYIAYTKWFKKNEVIKASIGEIGTVENMQAPFQALLFRLDQLGNSNNNANDRILDLERIDQEVLQSVQGDRNVGVDLENMRQTIAANASTLETLEESISQIQMLLGDIGPNFSKIKWASRVVIFGWYFAVPFLAFIAVIYIKYCTL